MTLFSSGERDKNMTNFTLSSEKTVQLHDQEGYQKKNDVIKEQPLSFFLNLQSIFQLNFHFNPTSFIQQRRINGYKLS